MLSMRKTPANYGWENLLLLFDAVNEAADQHTKNHTIAAVIGLLFFLIGYVFPSYCSS